jgi:hypothetical protein
MVLSSLACACAVRRDARNRSGFRKTSTETVRNILKDGLDGPSGYQAARSGLTTITAVRLYRAGQA